MFSIAQQCNTDVDSSCTLQTSLVHLYCLKHKVNLQNTSLPPCQLDLIFHWPIWHLISHKPTYCTILRAVSVLLFSSRSSISMFAGLHLCLSLTLCMVDLCVCGDRLVVYRPWIPMQALFEFSEWCWWFLDWCHFCHQSCFSFAQLYFKTDFLFFSSFVRFKVIEAYTLFWGPNLLLNVTYTEHMPHSIVVHHHSDSGWSVNNFVQCCFF